MLEKCYFEFEVSTFYLKYWHYYFYILLCNWIASALVSGLAMMSGLAKNRLHQSDFGFEDMSINFDQIDM